MMRSLIGSMLPTPDLRSSWRILLGLYFGRHGFLSNVESKEQQEEHNSKDGEQGNGRDDRRCAQSTATPSCGYGDIEYRHRRSVNRPGTHFRAIEGHVCSVRSLRNVSDISQSLTVGGECFHRRIEQGYGYCYTCDRIVGFVNCFDRGGERVYLHRLGKTRTCQVDSLRHNLESCYSLPL